MDSVLGLYPGTPQTKKITNGERKISMSRTENWTPQSGASESQLDSGTSVLAQLTGQGSIAPGIRVDRRNRGCRRNRSFRSFLRGNSNPRRRMHRRDDDHNLLLLDFYDPKMLYLALAILLLSCTDALFTLNLLVLGAEELNVFMQAMLDRSVPTFIGVKIGLTAVSVVVLVVVAQRRFMGWFRVVRVLQGICVAYVALIAYELYLFSQIMAW
jgi:hypothetical protein